MAVLVAGLVCQILTGCGGRPAVSGPRVSGKQSEGGAVGMGAKQVSPADQVRALQPAVAAGDPEAMSALVALVLGHAEDRTVRNLATAAAAGREMRYFERILARAVSEVRDIGDLIRGAASAVGQSGQPAAWLGVVREVSSRECCLRRSFLAAALDGLADGLGAAQVSPRAEAEAALRLGTLATNHDPAVAEAARRASLYFRAPLPARTGPGAGA